MRDRVIALDEFVAHEVPNPTALGAMRPADSKSTWQEDAMAAAKAQNRAVLSGDISNLEGITKSISEIRSNFPHAKFALLIHSKQAIAFRPPEAALSFFENVYVATSEEIEGPDIRQIELWWRATWVLMPTIELNQNDWISNFLLPNRQGRLILFAASLEPDELRLQLENFTFEHPLIDIIPAPHEWFIAPELGPWRALSRDPNRAQVLYDTRLCEEYLLSVIVPFHWTGEPAQIEMLSRSLKSIADTFASHEHCELIVTIDRERACSPPTAQDLNLGLANSALVDVERIDESVDWRAGFIRNCGANFARNTTGYFVFIDADVAIASTLLISRSLEDLLPKRKFDLLLLADNQGSLPFEFATSSLLVIRSSMFAQIGGFSAAFSRYGCEDNFLVWSATQNRATISVLPTSTVMHLRPRLESDDLIAKMNRLRLSADLMYRMTLDPDVHRHFFSALGEDLWWRAFLKRAASSKLTRIFLAPIVFFLTLIETRDRPKYLKSFLEVFLWKLKRPVLWLRANTWRTELARHVWRANAWKLPNFFVSRFGAAKIALENIWISLTANRFGLNSVAWRAELWSKILIDQIRWRASVSRIRFAGACLWILTAIVSTFSNIHWLLTVGVGRALGTAICQFTRLRTKVMSIVSPMLSIRGPLSRVVGQLVWFFGQLVWFFGQIRRLIVVYILVPMNFLASRPQAFWKLHSWRISKLAGDLRAEAWIFRAPTEWFKIRAPRFYKWLWRPLLKIRYFLQYHLITRWRST